MRPHHRFVDFVEAGKHKLPLNVLCQHSAFVESWRQCVLNQLADPSTWTWYHFSRNASPFAVELFEHNLSLLDIGQLCRNESPLVMPLLLECMLVDICWVNLSDNPAPHALVILAFQSSYIEWMNLSRNPGAMELLRANPGKVNWEMLSTNPSPDAHALLMAQMGRWDAATEGLLWSHLSSNPAPWAMTMLVSNLEAVDWFALSTNPAPEAIRLLAANPDKIRWELLSSNAGAMALLEANQEKIVWEELAHNPAIFVLDYVRMRDEMRPLREELLRAAMHPRRVSQVH
jgi:hypothetical protein